jgi:enoyl-CoA hydratase
VSFETIELVRHGPVAVITLNRPSKLNAINATMIDEINHALDELEGIDGVHAIVVNGNGRAFC